MSTAAPPRRHRLSLAPAEVRLRPRLAAARWCSGVARNFRQGVRQSVAFLSVHSRSAATKSAVQSKNVMTKIMYFPDRG